MNQLRIIRTLIDLTKSPPLLPATCILIRILPPATRILRDYPSTKTLLFSSDSFDAKTNTKPFDAIIDFILFTKRLDYQVKKKIEAYIYIYIYIYYIYIVRSCFDKRGYPKKLVDNQLRKVVENRLEQLPEHQTKHGTGVPLVVTYHTRFHDLGRIVRKKFIYLYAEE